VSVTSGRASPTCSESERSDMRITAECLSRRHEDRPRRATPKSRDTNTDAWVLSRRASPGFARASGAAREALPFVAQVPPVGTYGAEEHTLTACTRSALRVWLWATLRWRGSSVKEAVRDAMYGLWRTEAELVEAGPWTELRIYRGALLNSPCRVAPKG
jgi:hypothetical protein